MSRKYGAIYKACKKNKYMFTLFYDPQFIQYAAAWNFWNWLMRIFKKKEKKKKHKRGKFHKWHYDTVVEN